MKDSPHRPRIIDLKTMLPSAVKNANIKIVAALFSLGMLMGLSLFARQILALSPEEERAQLEQELKKLEQQIQQYEGDITKTRQEKQTLQNKIYTLRRQIEKLDLQISQGNIMIKDLNYQISDTEKSIGSTENQIEQQRLRLVKILRTLYQESQKSPLEMLLANAELSDFFENVVALERLHAENRKLLKNIKDLKVYLEDQKTSLAGEKEDLEKVVSIQILQKQQNLSAKQEHEQLLQVKETQEQVYQQLLATTQQRAAEIRARIFELIGVPKAPTFGEAVDIAKYVESVTGIRPAFLLAVLTQESNLGKDVGQCYLKDPKTGSGVVVYNGQTVSKVMHSSRDVPHFLNITAKLGRDPYNTQVSCPLPNVGGYGGAMGPGQFIPSTWVLVSPKVQAVTGKEPDPWNIKDAFLATGIYLRDLGGQQNEWLAAMRYFSGSSWTKYEEFYGDSVLDLAKKYQKDIETISQ